jgi:hypothetical protein
MEFSTVGEFIKELSKLDPSLPLYIRSKYTREVDYTKDYPVNIKGLSEMEPGEVGQKHACILF